MAYTLEQNKITGEVELLINGFEQGISDSPHFGLSDMRNINNDSIPGIALCNYKLRNTTQAPLSVAFTSVNNLLTLTTGTLTNNCSVKFTSLTGSSGLTGWATADSTSNIYYLVRQSNNTALVYSSFDPTNGVGTLVTLGTGAGTVTTIDMGKPTGYAIDNYNNYYSTIGGTYILDNNGRVWVKGDASHNFYYLKGNTLENAGTSGNGIVFYNNYLFVFRNAAIDVYDAYGQESSPYTWTNGWKTSINAAGITACNHYAKYSIVEQVAYFCDGRNVCSLHCTASPAPATPKIADLTITLNVLILPAFERTSCLEEPSMDTGNGTVIYGGTSTSNLIYPWDKHSTGTQAPLVITEVGTYQMLNINKIVYILAGKRGNIYYTNGSNVTLFKILPKQATRTPFPNWTWGGIMSLNNNLCFGAGDASNNASGVYAITLMVGQLLNAIAGAIRYKGQVSAGVYNAFVLIPFLNGLQYYAAWYNGTNGGIDYLDSVTPTFYSNYESYVESDIVPIGTALQGKTFNTIEYKLDTPMVNGEKIRLSMRSDLNTSYSQALENIATATYLPVDGSSNSIPIQLGKWVQVKAELQSLSGGSFVRLKEIRIR